MRVLIVVARHYNGNELGNITTTLRERGHTYSIASTAHVIIDEVTGDMFRIKRLIGEPDPDRYDGLIHSSGDMADCEAYWTNTIVLNTVDAFEVKSKPIAAVCISVPAIRFAAAGKRVSFFPLIRSRDLLMQAGAICTPVALTRDQNLVTAEHQMASEMMAIEYCNLLEGKPPQYNFTDSGYVPQGRPRRDPQALANIKEKLRHARIQASDSGS
jgi:putative intracellular protease/amidase